MNPDWQQDRGSRAGLSGRVALVTGGGRGIGRAVALEFARAGASIAIVARSAAELDDTARAIRALGVRVCSLAADLAVREESARIAAEAARALGPVDILVNNAGVGSAIDPRPVARFQDTTWDLTIALNLTAPFLLCRAVLPSMIARGWGRIINVSSINARTGASNGSAYAASKSGLLGFTRSLALEVARDGITVNAICPGPVRTRTSDTRLSQIAAERGVPLADLEATLTPLGRRLEPTEIAEVACFLAGDGAAGITGQAWNVDGGAVAS